MNEKQKALDLAITSIEKQFGKGSIMKLGGDKSLYDMYRFTAQAL